MGTWFNVPWSEILIPDHALQVVIRGSLIYLGLLIVLRIILKRQSGEISSSDLLVTVLIADAVQNGMAGEYKSVPDALILTSTIVGWDYLIDWLQFRYKFIREQLTSPPLPLIRDGRLLRKNMRRELITEEELWVKLRQNEIHNLDEVDVVYMESEGEISVLKKKRN